MTVYIKISWEYVQVYLDILFLKGDSRLTYQTNDIVQFYWEIAHF